MMALKSINDRYHPSAGISLKNLRRYQVGEQNGRTWF